jgi:pimeloyl-ACP methyl ester carboxylesterase
MINLRLLTIVFIAFLLMPADTQCQQYAGNWEGKLEVRKRMLELVFHISPVAENQYTATMDIPAQKLYNLPAGTVNASDQNIEIRFPALGIIVTGSPDGARKLKSIFAQNGLSFPFELKNTGEVTSGKKYNRPQTPVAPFPYAVEEVVFGSTDGTMQYSGTLTYPKDPTGGLKRYPAILLITGSGPQDRDETMFDHKPFAVLADQLTKAGYAVLRVDDRGMGATGGIFPRANTGDFAYDAENSLNFLKTRKETDTTRLGLLGHSEGGLIAAMLASKRRDINFIILMASPVTDPLDLVAEQSADMLVSRGVDESKTKEFRPLMRDIVTAILSAPDSSTAMREATSVFTRWEATQSQKIIRLTTGVRDEKSMQLFIGRLMSLLANPWYQYYMRMQPAAYYKAISCKVLALFGEKDIQVDPVINSDLLRTYLPGRGKEALSIHVLSGLNHLFQHCKKCTFAEYAELEETLAPEFQTLVVEWLNKNIAEGR